MGTLCPANRNTADVSNHNTEKRRDVMPVMSGFSTLAGLPWERINDKIERRILAGKQGMIVWWKMKAGAHAASHQLPHEQIVWMLHGRMDFRIGSDRRFDDRGRRCSDSRQRRARRFLPRGHRGNRRLRAAA
jgi:hypothetical protein